MSHAPDDTQPLLPAIVGGCCLFATAYAGLVAGGLVLAGDDRQWAAAKLAIAAASVYPIWAALDGVARRLDRGRDGGEGAL